MQVMLLAAGSATRLRPLSLVRPKVLVPIMGVPVLDFWVRRLADGGCRKLVMNAHHLHDRLTREVESRRLPYPFEVVVERTLLGTAGGIRNALDRFGNDSICVINGDIVCDVSLERVAVEHRHGGSAVSLLLHDFEPFNNVAVDERDRIVAFGDRAARLARRRADIRLRAFTGIQVLEPRALEYLPAGKEIDIIDVYRDRIAAGKPPRALFLPSFFWREMGSIDAYRRLHRELADRSVPTLPEIPSGTSLMIAGDCRLGDDIALEGMVVWGRGGFIGEGARLENVIAWNRVRVAAGVCLSNCILTDGVAVDEDLHDSVVTAEEGKAALRCPK